MVKITTTTTITTEDAHQHIQWVKGSRHLYACMYVCMYLCKVVVGKRYVCKCIPFHRVRVMVTSCVHVRMPYCVIRAMHGWWLMDDCRLWWLAVEMLALFSWKSDRVNMVDWMIEWMHAWTDCCLCVCFCMCMCMWFGRLVCRAEQSTLFKDKEPLRIAISLQMKQNLM